jgi:hypothetical protein
MADKQRAFFASQWEAAEENWATAADVIDSGEEPKLSDGHHRLKQPNGDVYEGGVVNQMMHGRGVMTYTSGNRYEGEFEQNKRHGRGVFTYADGSSYDGEWVWDEKEGKCALITTGRDRFEGVLHGGRYHGSGTMIYADGREYRGEFVSGQRHGTGVLKNKNGDLYEGQFDHGKQSGDCVITYASKKRFVGVVEDLKKVRGEMAFADGKVYAGEWQAEKPHGQGKCLYKNGDVYEGEWNAGRVTGNGTMQYADGRRYTGSWLDDKYHGEGVATLLSGKLVDATWEMGKQVGLNRAPAQQPTTIGAASPKATAMVPPSEPVANPEPASTSVQPVVAEPAAEPVKAAAEPVVEPVKPTEEPVAKTVKPIKTAPAVSAQPVAQSAQPSESETPQSNPSVDRATAAPALHATVPVASQSVAQVTLGQHATQPPGQDTSDQDASPGTHSAAVPGVASASSASPVTPDAEVVVPRAAGDVDDEIVLDDEVVPLRAAENSDPSPDQVESILVEPPPANDGAHVRSAADVSSPHLTSSSTHQQQPSNNASAAGPSQAAAVTPPPQSPKGRKPSAFTNGSPSASFVSTSAIPQEHEGWLEKYSVGKSFFSFGNWKRRYFRLRDDGLSYFETDDAASPELGKVSVGNLNTRLVSKPSAKTHKKAQFADRDLVIVYTENSKELRLLMRCATAGEQSEWVSALMRHIDIVDDRRDL